MTPLPCEFERQTRTKMYGTYKCPRRLGKAHGRADKQTAGDLTHSGAPDAPRSTGPPGHQSWIDANRPQSQWLAGVPRRHLYGIPITLRAAPSRKPTPDLTRDGPEGSGICLIHRNPHRPANVRVVVGQVHKELLMLDVIMLALGLGFFVVSIGYAYACDRL